MPVGTSHFVRLGGLDFHYVAWGGTGAPVILLHGLASTVHIWDLVAPRLAAQGRVTALDQRGHGLSSQPPDGYDFATIGADLVRFVQALGIDEPFFLVGHSAYVALTFAHAHGDMLRGAVLVDGGVMDLKTQWPTWEIAQAKMTPPDLDHKTVAEMQVMIRHDWLGAAWTPETGEMAFQVYKTDEQGYVTPRLQLRNHMQIAHAIWQLTPADYFTTIQCPLLLVVPEPPGMAQPDAWQMAKRQQVSAAEAAMPDGEVFWMPETIHDIPWQRPQRLAGRIVEFIQAHSRVVASWAGSFCAGW
jgi:pimeloyl-ACP methyl ester carboxylesterase